MKYSFSFVIILALWICNPTPARADYGNTSSPTTTADSTANKKKIDMKKDFSSLGDNQQVIERAKLLDPKNKYKVVQSRAIDRNLRFEFGANYGGILAGGDSYYTTQNLGLNFDFHITPYWSVGARYYQSYNTLNAEGNSAFSNAQADKNAGLPYTTPAIDYPTSTTLGVVNWYPFYGKMDLFGSITHFDLYFLGGYGKTALASGLSDTYALGGGLGIWITNWLAARLEGRYQTYTDHPYYDTPAAYSRQVSEFVPMVSLGFML